MSLLDGLILVPFSHGLRCILKDLCKFYTWLFIVGLRGHVTPRWFDFGSIFTWFKMHLKDLCKFYTWLFIVGLRGHVTPRWFDFG